MTTKLEIQPVPSNSCKTLRFADNSYYNPDIEVQNAIFEVTPPGFDYSINFNVDAHFNLILNSSNLKILPAVSATNLVALPEGIYRLKYSIKPNASLYVEYDYLRNCQLLQRYYNSLCELIEKKCDVTKANFQELRRQIIWIKELIDASKFMVEERGKPDEGLELYNEAKRLLDNFNECDC